MHTRVKNAVHSAADEVNTCACVARVTRRILSVKCIWKHKTHTYMHADLYDWLHAWKKAKKNAHVRQIVRLASHAFGKRVALWQNVKKIFAAFQCKNRSHRFYFTKPEKTGQKRLNILWELRLYFVPSITIGYRLQNNCLWVWEISSVAGANFTLENIKSSATCSSHSRYRAQGPMNIWGWVPPWRLDDTLAHLNMKPREGKSPARSRHAWVIVRYG